MTQNSPENRYARQIALAPIGSAGRQRIAAASVTVLGCGALGSVAAELLARSGVGTLRLVDRDVVEWTNLQRQGLFDESDAEQGVAKAAAACRRLHQINSSIRLEPMVVDVTAENIQTVLAGSDLVIDAADNFGLRFLLNDWSLSNSVPWVHGGCVGTTGQSMLFTGAGQPCFRCFVDQPPSPASVETCDTAGVLGAATHAIASLQVAEAIKWLSGNQAAVRTTLLSIDFWRNRIRDLPVPHRTDCLACNGTYDFLDGSTPAAGQHASVLCGRDSIQIHSSAKPQLDLSVIAARWNALGEVQINDFFVRLHLSDHTLTLFRDGRAVVSGTTVESEAKAIYARFVGG